MSNDLWRWADPQGQQRKVRLDELRAALAEGHLAPNTPVWREGFHQWQPANEVPELSSASVGSATGVVLNIPPPPLAMVAVQQEYEAAAGSIVPAPLTPRATAEEEPPPPPPYIPAATRPVSPDGTGALRTQLAGSAWVPPAPGSAPSGPSRPPPPPGSGPSAAPIAPALPTTLGMPTPQALLSQQAQAGGGDFLSGSLLVDDTSSHGYVNAASAASADGLPPPTNPILYDGAVPERASLADAGLPRRPGLSLILDDIVAIREGRPPRNKLLVGVLGVVGLSVLVTIVAGIVSLASGSGDTKAADKKAAASASAPVAKGAAVEPPPPAASPTVEAPATAAAAATAETKTDATFGDCTLAGDTRTIAPKVLITSGLEGHLLGQRLGLGFATSGRDAVALSLDPGTLTPSTPVHAKTTEPRRVTPLSIGGKLAAVADVDRKGDRLSGRRVVNALFDLGAVEGGVAWAHHRRDNVTKLFSVDGEGTIEALRGTSLGPRKGIALTFRRGNAVYIGAARGDGTLEAHGALSKIAGLGQVGSPAIAVSGDQIVVAWADRAGASDEWRIRWTKVRAGSTTEEATSFALPEGGLGGPAMSPSLASLGGGRFLLAWAEGPVSNHQVRAITMDADGAPSGSPLVISASGVNAGQPTALVASDGRGAVAFLTAKGKALEVRATPIRCAAR